MTEIRLRSKSDISFSVITPSLNMLPFLKRCVSSVGDQMRGDFEHIVVDGVSTDGTVEWLRQKKDIDGIVEPDSGMYEAVNKGFLRAKGRILSYLNCDEQYLPGTLEWVKTYFDAHEDVDILFGDALLIRPNGSLLAYWKGYRPRRFYILSSYLYLLTCTMFIRKRIVEEGHLFSPDFKCRADAEFVVRMLRSSYKIRHVRRYMSAFTITGKNLSLDRAGQAESRMLRKQLPAFLRSATWILNSARLVEKLLSGAYFQSMPLNYEVYTDGDAKKRTFIQVEKASPRWKNE